MRIPNGYTLIELLILTALLGILAALCLPYYQAYAIRARIAEGVNMTHSVTTAITEYRQSKGVWPSNNAEAGLPLPPVYRVGNISSLTVNNGQVTVAMDPALVGLSAPGDIVLQPSYAGAASVVEWTCGTSSTAPIPDRYLPSPCLGHVF